MFIPFWAGYWKDRLGLRHLQGLARRTSLAEALAPTMITRGGNLWYLHTLQLNGKIVLISDTCKNWPRGKNSCVQYESTTTRINERWPDLMVWRPIEVSPWRHFILPRADVRGHWHYLYSTSQGRREKTLGASLDMAPKIDRSAVADLALCLKTRSSDSGQLVTLWTKKRQHCQKKLVSWLKRLRDSFNGGGSLSTFGNT